MSLLTCEDSCFSPCFTFGFVFTASTSQWTETAINQAVLMQSNKIVHKTAQKCSKTECVSTRWKHGSLCIDFCLLWSLITVRVLELSQGAKPVLVHYITFIWQTLLSKMTYIFGINMQWEQFGAQCFSQGRFDMKMDQPTLQLMADLLYQLIYRRPN